MDDKALHPPGSNLNVVSPEEYGRKRAQIEAAKAFLERIENENEVGRAKYEADLLHKVREGEEARQRLLDLERSANIMKGPLAIEAAPSTARIEELPATSPQPQWTTSPAPPFQSSFRLAPPTQPTTMPLPPIYNSFTRQPPQRQSYSTGSRHPPVPQPQIPVAPHVSNQVQHRFQHHYQIPTANQQVNGLQKPAVQYQKPSVAPPARPSSSQILRQSQAQTTVMHGSVESQSQVKGNTYRDIQRPVHYKPMGVQPVGTSSLTGALGPQTSQSTQPSASPPLVAASSPVVPENVPKPLPIPQVAKTAPGSESRPAVSLSDSELEERKSKILAFRSSILEWARTSRPNTFTEFVKIKVYKAPNSVLYITSVSEGQQIVEEQNTFFERLWVMSGLPPDTIPFGQESTSGPSVSDVSTHGHSTPSTAPRSIALPTQAVSIQQGAGSSKSTTLSTRVSPRTPRERTLVDPVTGIWRSPADADKKRLARDLIHALGKRKQDLVSQSSSSENPAKRQALESPSISGSAHRIPEPVFRGSTTASTNASQSTEQQLQPVVTSRPVTAPEASNRVQGPATSVEPSGQRIEPPPPPTVMASTTLPSQSDSRSLQNDIPVPPNPKESRSFSVSSVPSLQNADTGETAGQVILQSQSLPSEGPATVPPQVSLPSSLTSARATSTFPQQESGKPAPATSVTPLRIAVPNTSIAQNKIIAASSILQGDKMDNQPHGSIELVAGDPEPPTSSQSKTHPPSSSQVIRSEQDASSSLLKSNDDSSGGAWPSGFDLSQGASTSTAREPLFLPSPSPSSSPLPSKKNKFSSSVYVLVPPPPEYLIRYRKRQSRKAGLDSLKDSTRNSSVVSTSRTSRSLEDFRLPLERERDIVIDPHEQEAVQLSCSRLQPLTCRWGECGITLNSVDALIRHLNREHKPVGTSFICRWTQCGRQCRFHEKHLEKHATMTLQCAYQGCKESYRTGSQLLKHFRAKHLNGILKVQAKPFHHAFQPPAPLPNTISPSYLIVTTPVTPTPISADQHSVLGPWVLRHVVGVVGDRPKRAKKSNGSGSTAEVSNTYEFLNMRSTRYSWNQSKPVDMVFADLDSEEISKECDQGLTFFGTEDSGREDDPPSEEEIFFSSPPKTNGDVHNVNPEILDSPTEPSDEEKMVQKLLIE